jgi:exodeoxyribonuclease VII small subunit
MGSMGDCNFEKDLEQLEQIVAALEEGGLSLDDSLKQFEHGIKLARRCEKALTEAEKKIELLTRKANGDLAAEPFEDAADPAATSDGKAKPAPAVKVEETAVAERTVEVVAKKRRTEVVQDDGDDDDEQEVLF